MNMFALLRLSDNGSVKVLEMNISKDPLEVEKEKLDQYEEGERLRTIEFWENAVKENPENHLMKEQLEERRIKKEIFFIKQIAFID